MDTDKILGGVFILIVLYLVATQWQAFNQLAQTGSRFAYHYTEILQGRGSAAGGQDIAARW